MKTKKFENAAKLVYQLHEIEVLKFQELKQNGHNADLVCNTDWLNKICKAVANSYEVDPKELEDYFYGMN